MIDQFTPPPATPAAVILAGGRGERLGGAIKSGLVIGGVRLLERVARVLEGCCQPILVAHGPLNPALLHLPPGLVGVADLTDDHAGPLAGLAAAIAWLDRCGSPAELLVSAAVDTPFLPLNFVDHLRDGLGGASAGLATYSGQHYPTNAVWRRNAVRDLPDRILDGTAPRSLKGLAQELGAASIEWPSQASGDPFANINTPQDLAALARRASSEAPP